MDILDLGIVKSWMMNVFESQPLLNHQLLDESIEHDITITGNSW